MRRNFLKIGLAAAMTLTGVATIAPQKIVNAATLKAPIKRVQINYLPGKDVKIWTNYQKGQLISFRAKNNSKWNVAETAVDKKGNLWYKIGDNEWIEARYTKDLDGEDNESNDKSANNKKDKKAKKQKQPKQTNKEVTPKPTSVTKKPKKPSQAPKNPSSLPAATAPAATGSAAQRQQAVVKLAKSQVGKGYVWGGNGPDAYDCSGLVQSIYSKVGGVQLPRVTTDQVKMGTTVSMDQLQPGDLLYWGSVDAPYHIGIYIGNNQYVHASTPDKGVVLDTISSYFYPCVAKRVIQ
ncbi:C40 family peptidase [Lactobacillus apis]|uniref:C40 family peptidase n=1 Tax=Lactobacillus apis TaxID=303541 RepID=UPI0024315334|nr:C40 family peptidase [Lactobacillus apis]